MLCHLIYESPERSIEMMADAAFVIEGDLVMLC
jgi:hypothetical protein